MSNCKRNCSELSSLRKDIVRDFKPINAGNRKIDTVICIRTATLLLNVHATQLQQAIEERENNLLNIL